MNESPAVVLCDIDGNSMAVVDGLSLPVNTKAIVFSGKDGSGNARFLLTNTLGRLQVDVATLPSVTVTATDLDIRPLDSGADSVAAVQSGVWNIGSITGAITLPTNAATETSLTSLIALITARLPVPGQAVMAASVPVAIASDQSPLPVSAAALPLPAGASTEATLALIKAKTDNLDVALSTRAVTGLTDTELRATPVPVAFDSLVQKKVYDISDTVIYSGSAPLGTATSAAAWRISKTTLSGGNPVLTVWTGATAIWDNRVTESYS